MLMPVHTQIQLTNLLGRCREDIESREVSGGRWHCALMDGAHPSTSSMLTVYTHTHSCHGLLIDVLSSSVVSFSSLVPLGLLLFIKWSFPSAASANESAAPPRNHSSRRVAAVAHKHFLHSPPILPTCHRVPLSIRAVCRSPALIPCSFQPSLSLPVLSLWPPCHCV